MNPGLLLLLVHGLLAIVAIVSILRRRKDPMAMLAWIFAVVVVPLLGSVLYFLMGEDRVRRRAVRKRRRVAHLLTRLSDRAARRSEPVLGQHDTVLPVGLRPIERIGRRLADMPAVGGNAVEVYDEGKRTFAALEAAVRGARQYVHMEYYIWQADRTGAQFRDLLVEKARAGVECRVLLDAVGCLRLTRRFLRPWKQAGVKFAFFLPLEPLRRRISPHLRNHRKITVVDGHTAFVGSQNIGDEYRGWRRLGPWYDSNLKVVGPAALFVEQTFAEDWLFATREDLGDDRYFPEPPWAGESVVQVLPTGPDQDVSALAQLVFAAVAAAERSIRVETPYFVPHAALQQALLHAALRGVRVQLVVPTRSDALLVLWAGRSFYRELIDAGVELYEFDDGMLHAKIMTIDDRWCMLGSANMDIRSFRLNFEITALVYDAGVSARLGQLIEQHCRQSRRIRAEDMRRRPVLTELAEGAARLFAPLL